MELNELIREVLLQMYRSGLPDREALKRLDATVLDRVKEGNADEKAGACQSCDSGAAGRQKRP